MSSGLCVAGSVPVPTADTGRRNLPQEKLSATRSFPGGEGSRRLQRDIYPPTPRAQIQEENATTTRKTGSRGSAEPAGGRALRGSLRPRPWNSVCPAAWPSRGPPVAVPWRVHTGRGSRPDRPRVRRAALMPHEPWAARDPPLGSDVSSRSTSRTFQRKFQKITRSDTLLRRWEPAHTQQHCC